MEARLSIVTLGVADLQRSIRFYRDGLGLPMREGGGDVVAVFETHGTWLALFPRDSLAADATVQPEGDGFCGFSLAHNVRTREEVDALLEEAVGVGATLVKPAQDATGADTPATSQTQTDSFGRWRGTRISGWNNPGSALFFEFARGRDHHCAHYYFYTDEHGRKVGVARQRSQCTHDGCTYDQHGRRIEPLASAGRQAHGKHDPADQKKAAKVTDLGACGRSLEQRHAERVGHVGGHHDPLNSLQYEQGCEQPGNDT